MSITQPKPFLPLSGKLALIASYIEGPVECQRAIDNTRARQRRQPTVAAYEADGRRVDSYLEIAKTKGWNCK